MSTDSVPSTSIRGCPSSLAGTTCRRDRSRISATAHKNTIRCRTDRSGSFRRCATHPRHPRLSATIPIYSRLTPTTPTQEQLAAGACSNSPTEPFSGLPVGDKRAFPSLTVSAPNSSQKCNLLQKWRDRRPPHSRPLQCSRRGDRSIISLPPPQRAPALLAAMWLSCRLAFLQLSPNVVEHAPTKHCLLTCQPSLPFARFQLGTAPDLHFCN